jgi:hypothetical protein
VNNKLKCIWEGKGGDLVEVQSWHSHEGTEEKSKTLVTIVSQHLDFANRGCFQKSERTCFVFADHSWQ